MKSVALLLFFISFIAASDYRFDRTLLLQYSVVGYTGFRVDIASNENILVYLITDKESSLNFTNMDIFHYLSEGSCPKKTKRCEEGSPSSHILLNDYVYVGVFCDEERPGCRIHDKSRALNNDLVLFKDLIKMTFATLLLAIAGILPLVVGLVLLKKMILQPSLMTGDIKYIEMVQK